MAVSLFDKRRHFPIAGSVRPLPTHRAIADRRAAPSCERRAPFLLPVRLVGLQNEPRGWYGGNFRIQGKLRYHVHSAASAARLARHPHRPSADESVNAQSAPAPAGDLMCQLYRQRRAAANGDGITDMLVRPRRIFGDGTTHNPAKEGAAGFSEAYYLSEIRSSAAVMKAAG